MKMKERKYKIFYQNIGKKIRGKLLPAGFGKKEKISINLKKLCKSLGKFDCQTER